jgi:hypothetical protein
MRSRIGILRLTVVVGLSLLGSQLAGRACFAEGDEGAAEEPVLAEERVVAEEPVLADSDGPAESDADAAQAEAAQPVVAAAGQRVRMRLDVSGELFAGTGRDGATVREPVAMNARFDFDERPDAAGTATARRYRDATAALELAGQQNSTTLAGDARQLLVVRRGTTPSAYLEHGFLTRDEADLLETPFDSLLIDDLLPLAAVRLDERWDVAADLAAGLLAIDTIESGGLVARLVEVTDGRAKVIVEGMVDGAADGAPTHVTVEGSFFATVVAASMPPASRDGDGDGDGRFVFQGRIAQATVVMRERRQPSHVAPGFDVEARLAVARGPIDSDTVEDEAVASAAAVETADHDAPALRRRGAGEPGRLWHRDPASRFDLVHDARWKRVEDGPHGLVLRLVDHGALVGQCSIMCLPGAAAAEPPSVADVRRDFERSLAGQVSRIDEADETVRDDGLRVVRLEAAGTAGGLSFRWMHYVLAGAEGRASVTFMCEEPLRPRFGDADRRLVEGLRLLVAAKADDPAAAAESGGRPGATAARPVGGAGPRR